MATSEKATFAAGCFWGVEADFRKVDGVLDAQVGYIGGSVERPTYQQVCTDSTGHAEAVEVVFDPKRVSYERLLAIFFAMHDPTQKNRQGPDVGSQYRSAVFYHDEAQRSAAAAKISELSKSRAIATTLEPAAPFWRAEEYHQQYHAKHGGSCNI
ncbi:MAG: peptide-methionine (S)-S-oxide reductase [Elusimicrobia bacterium CG1_02_63_36]|nr:MAG: peptide-methionine (S)-S-oxide reductase [Elusimicrobia bacterium CG1_02_63_36]PIP84891.1 MAG: peptide-methionine (S)-S-oxide reductase [Elusimicrobia bacterium CG22_combo_CG10-13_8_21_14_all_63_91]PJA13396.1 MAG: peptide-methionine (S)-S-oxide reductase [Elusimicrobia bacterium CG_4_10_14_0_2_um_filter_63_34]PJB25631.1 MAG: peptide-methionine (S)-S-oxide reductase [Elusimicrobia bacterium CG_4_9_14_3_um_filter_62_55]